MCCAVYITLIQGSKIGSLNTVTIVNINLIQASCCLPLELLATGVLLVSY